MIPQWVIEQKRDGQSLSDDEIRAFISDYTSGNIPDYQMAALAMAIFFRGLDDREVATLTDAMMRSGDQIDTSVLDMPTSDKHSTGGIGDKVSLLLAPMVACCGVGVPMLSGRGLGITGGTLDKLEAIPGYRTNLDTKAFLDVIRECGCAITGQTASLAPADRKLYALRDVTGTVPSIPLANLNMHRQQQQHRGANQLSLQAPPGGFAGQLRPLMLIDAPEAPGYLREAVFPDFAGGTWVRGREQPVTMTPLPESDQGLTDQNRYSLLDPPMTTTETDPLWEMIYLRGVRSPDLFLPAGTHAFGAPAEVEVRLDAAGIASFANMPQQRVVRVQVDARAASRMRYGSRDVLPPWVADTGLQRVPEGIEADVSAWVIACEGLLEAAATVDAVDAVVTHFRMHYTYDLAGPDNAQPDLLRAFMRDRRGHCTLFASAATLMLRARGIPARVVGGYFTTEWQSAARRWVVRERHGHAWCEAWDAQRGVWMLVEATPPGGMPDGFDSPGAWRVWREAAALWLRNFLQALRSGDWLGELLGLFAVWILAVAQYRWWLAAGTGGCLAAWGVWRVSRRRALSPEQVWRERLVRRMMRLERRLVTASQRRQPAESWAAWEIRVQEHLTAEQATYLRRLVEAYQRLRYAPHFARDAAQQWLEDNR